ncbi:MAG: FKBP-type peptidyl-prolyl cis-trans isomerase [Gemmatimonadetes bacterium]|nr:FKBP-type peptidyl-prolyl cis-trans isomerase [Gemmatimonadota bacterium]
MSSTFRRTAALLSLVVAAGCSTSADTPATAPDISTVTFASSLGIDLTQFTKTATGLYYRDVTVGTGAQVSSGQNITTNYVGWLTNGTQFDAGTLPFTFGVGQVIAGWDQGLGGMKVGGTRMLIIPPALGYGAQGSGKIPGNAILVFRVSLLSIP